MVELIRVVGLLARATFNKSLGLDPHFVRGFISISPRLLYYPQGSSTNYGDNGSLLQINAVKATGIFINQAGLIPLRCLFIYKEILESNLIP